MSSSPARSLVATLTIVLAGATAAFGGDSLELDEFLAQVRSAHPGLAAARLRAGAVARAVGPARAWDDPFVAIGPDGIAESGGGAELVRYQVSQSIPFPGKRAARGDAAEATAGSAEAEVGAAERRLAVAATQLFYRAVHTARALDLNRDLSALVGDAAASGEARYRTGGAAHHEWLLATAELGVLATERARLDGEASGLRAEMNELRDQPPDAPLGTLVLGPVTDDDPEPSPAEASPELLALDAAVRGAEAERRGALLAPLPDVVVQGMLEDPRDPMEDRMWGFMVGVTVPLFWPWKQGELLAAAERARDAALAERRALANRLGAEVVRARAELATARRTLELYDRDVLPATEMALASARTGYAVGGVSLSDLIAVARSNRAQALERLGARIDVELARTRLRELLSDPPVLRLAPASPTLFATGTGMGGGMASGAAMTRSPPTAVRLGRGVGTGAARGGGVADTGGASMGGM